MKVIICRFPRLLLTIVLKELLSARYKMFGALFTSHTVLLMLLLLGLCFVSTALAAQTSWQIVGPGGGGVVQDIAFDPFDDQRMYLTSNMIGVFRSDDAGEHWQWRSNGAGTQLGGVAIDPGRPDILYAVGPEGIFQSKDMAEHWQLVYSKGNDFKGISNQWFGSLRHSIFGKPGQTISINLEGVVYFGTVVGDIIMTRDKGESFEVISTGGKTPVGNIIALDNKRVAAALYGNGIYISTDGGSTWRNVLSSVDGTTLAIAVHPVKRNNVYALLSQESIRPMDSTRYYPLNLYKSIDGGENWKPIRFFRKVAIRKTRRMMDISKDGTIIILTARGPIRSIDDGRTWHKTYIDSRKDDGLIYDEFKGKANGPLSVYSDYRIPERWFMTDMLAAFRSDDDGKTWQYKVKGLREQAYWFVKVNPSDPDIVIASDLDHGLIRSINGGISWEDIVLVDPFEECDQMRFLPGDASHNILYAFFYHPYPFIAKSTDRGENWSVISRWENKQRMAMTRFALSRGDKLPVMYIGEPHKGVWKSVDEGNTWTLKNKGLTKPEAMKYIQFIESDKRGYLYVGIASKAKGQGGIFKSIDAGETWFPVNAGLPLFVRRGSLEIDFNNPDILWVSAGNSVYKSMNAGKSWAKKIEGLLSSAILIEPDNPENVYVASFAGGGIVKQYTAGIFKSVDGGNYFFNISGELLRSIGSTYRVYDLEYGWKGPGRIWAAPNGGGLIYSDGELQ